MPVRRRIIRSVSNSARGLPTGCVRQDFQMDDLAIRPMCEVFRSASTASNQRSYFMLTVTHLGKSQSERIVWLCEELEIPYELKTYARDAKTMLAQADYKALHPIGSAPVITDGDLLLAESGAIVEYLTAKHGKGRLTLGG